MEIYNGYAGYVYVAGGVVMNTILSFIIGLVLGSWFGVGLYALLVANEDDNDDEFHHNETGY